MIENVMSDITANSMDWNIQDKFKGLSLEEINKLQPKFPYAICLINTTGSLNVGVALRSAVLFGASRFYIVGKRRYDKRSTVGAQNYIDLKRVDAITDEGVIDSPLILETIQDDGYIPILLETGERDISNIFFDQEKIKPCFVFGEEKAGIPQDMLNAIPSTHRFSIPTYGVLRSLNVSVAASIVMHEFSKMYSGVTNV